MEITKISEINHLPHIKKTILNDIRQSSQWNTFFNSIGFKSFKLSNGTNVFYIRTFIGTFAKTSRTINLTNDILKELDFKCKKNKISLLKIDIGLNQDEKVLVSNKYIKSNSPLTPTKVQLIDLTLSEKDLLNSFSKSAKYSIKRGIRENTTVQFIKKPSIKELRDFYEKVQKPRAKNIKYHVPSFEQTLKRSKCFNENVVLSFVYDNKKNLCGGKVYYLYKNMAYYMFGGTTQYGEKNKSGYVQMWESIKYFKKLKVEVLNLDGVYDSRYSKQYKKWKGFSDFKLKFSGYVVKYPSSYIKVYSPIYNLLPLYFKKNI